MTTRDCLDRSRRSRAGLGTLPGGKRRGARLVGGTERANRVAAAGVPEHPVVHAVVVSGLDLCAHMLGAVSRGAEREILIPRDDPGSVGDASASSLRVTQGAVDDLVGCGVRPRKPVVAGGVM